MCIQNRCGYLYIFTQTHDACMFIVGLNHVDMHLQVLQYYKKVDAKKPTGKEQTTEFESACMHGYSGRFQQPAPIRIGELRLCKGSNVEFHSMALSGKKGFGLHLKVGDGLLRAICVVVFWPTPTNIHTFRSFLVYDLSKSLSTSGVQYTKICRNVN